MRPDYTEILAPQDVAIRGCVVPESHCFTMNMPLSSELIHHKFRQVRAAGNCHAGSGDLAHAPSRRRKRVPEACSAPLPGAASTAGRTRSRRGSDGLIGTRTYRVCPSARNAPLAIGSRGALDRDTFLSPECGSMPGGTPPEYAVLLPQQSRSTRPAMELLIPPSVNPIMAKSALDLCNSQ